MTSFNCHRFQNKTKEHQTRPQSQTSESFMDSKSTLLSLQTRRDLPGTCPDLTRNFLPSKKKEKTPMARVNEEEQIAERFSMNSLLNSGMHLLTFMSTTLAAASLLSYSKQTYNVSTTAMVALGIASCLLAMTVSWAAYYVYRAECDQEFNHPSKQSKLFALNGLVGAALGCTVVFTCL